MEHRILVSNPSMHKATPYLPYFYGLAKRSLEELKDTHIQWISPFFGSPDKPSNDLIEYYVNLKPTLLICSCYEWNFEFQKEFSIALKHHLPDLLVLFGGPQVDYKSPQLKQTLPQADLISDLPIEIVLPSVILAMNQQNLSQQVIDKLKDNKYNPSSAKTSVYQLYYEEYQNFQNALNNEKLHSFTLLETNRGCPYGCTFCDWGSLTQSKVKEFSLEVVLNDIEFIAKIGVNSVVLTDANFGMLERDLEIAKHLANAKRDFGFPKTVFFSMAKSHAKRVAEICNIFNDAGLLNYPLQIPIQSFSDNALKVINRKNLSDESLKIFKQRTPTLNVAVALILGCPGETVKSWYESMKRSVEELSVHLRIYDWSSLPNAPACDPAYAEKYKIDFQERPLRRLGTEERTEIEKSVYLVSSFSFSRKEWVEMKLLSTAVLALFTMGLGKTLFFLRSQQDLKDSHFDILVRNFQSSFKNEFSIVEDHLNEFLENPNQSIKIQHLNSDMEIEEFIYLHATKSPTQFFDFVRKSYFDICGKDFEKETEDQKLKLIPQAIQPNKFKSMSEFIDALGPVFGRTV